MNQPQRAHVSILGGGPAGLFAGYYLKENGVPFTIYEEKDRIGGNCVTSKYGDFYLDSGAHRLHDKDREITDVVSDLLGEDLLCTRSQSQIVYGDEFIDFPLTLLNLIRHLGLAGAVRAACQVVRSRLTGNGRSSRNFEDLAVHIYGRTIADRFLLAYSEKLWGIPCKEISSSMAMTRLKGLNLRTFLKEMLRRENADVDHFEGTFRYPRYGIGMIAEKLGEACGRENIRTRAKVTKVSHGDGRVQTVTVNGAQEIAIEDVISTLPLPYFLEIMDPPPDENILALARGLHYRSLILVAFFLRKGMVSPSAAVYFPGPEFIFTRAYEPRNRSPFMSPPGKTSLVVEIPCNLGDDYWKTEDDRLIELVLSQLSETGWVKPDEIIDSRVKRMEYAYPVLEVGTEEKTQRMLDFLRGFENLQIAGRNGRFTYTSIHEVLRLSKEIVAEYVA